jgi:hypothetical protein
VPGFTLQAIWAWAKGHLAPNCAVFSDGLACFGAVLQLTFIANQVDD